MSDIIFTTTFTIAFVREAYFVDVVDNGIRP